MPRHEDPERCYASEQRDDWMEPTGHICERCGCTQPNPECQECRDGTDDPVDHRDPYKEDIERQDTNPSSHATSA